MVALLQQDVNNLAFSNLQQATTQDTQLNKRVTLQPLVAMHPHKQATLHNLVSTPLEQQALVIHPHKQATLHNLVSTPLEQQALVIPPHKQVTLHNLVPTPELRPLAIHPKKHTILVVLQDINLIF
uniref:Uncharacterized protein n=1 Tax=Cacopsylla melanoneura TaxID=428564 RepID=A0A8D8W7R0_9HEMI